MDIHSAISKIKDTYANHPSIIEIKKDIKNEKAFSFKEVAEEEILKLLKNIDVKKSTGEDKLHSKLVNCAASYIYISLTLIINQSLKISTFPNNAKGAVVTPLDKGSLNKNDVIIFRPVSVLNCFSKIFKNVMKGQLMPFIENYVFLSAYRSSYSS